MTTFKKLFVRRFISVVCIFAVMLSLFAIASIGVNADESDDSEIKTFGAFEYYKDTNGIVINRYTGDGIADVSIPNTIEDKPVVSLADEAFWYCDELVAVDLPDYLEHIGARVFQGCKNLSYIDVPDSVVEIGDAAFDGCSALAEFKIPAELVYVGGFAFDGTQWITKFEDNDSVILGGRIFYKYKGTAPVVNIPQEVVSISSNAFSGNHTLTYVKVPDSLMFIGSYAFYDCPELDSLCVPDGMYFMGDYSLGFDGIDQEGNGIKNQSFVLYANQGTLGADYAKKWELPIKAAKYNPTPDEMPDEEVCVAKDIETDTVVPQKENTLVAVILIVGGCVFVIGGLYAYFSIADKKYKAKLEEKKNNKAALKKKDKKKKK